jgi:hypothetical protein
MTTAHDLDLAAPRERATHATNGRDDRALIRFATLAASSHNTQPWRFRIAPDAIMIIPDLSRRCPVVDPDDAHLYRSLGCATENLVQAAAAQGLATDVRFDVAQDAVVIDLTPSTAAAPSELFEVISARQSSRLAFNGTPVTTDDLRKLELAGTGSGARSVLVTDPAEIASISHLVAAGNRAQLTDGAFRRELVSWIRFNPAAAVRTGDGLAGRCAGNPSLPTWLGKLLAPIVIRASTQAERDTEYTRSSAGIAVFVADRDDKPAWIETGRAYQRFALQAAALEIRTAFINQPIEVTSLRGSLETLLGLDGERAQLVVRFGHGDLAPYSLRRPIDDVIDP